MRATKSDHGNVGMVDHQSFPQVIVDGNETPTSETIFITQHQPGTQQKTVSLAGLSEWGVNKAMMPIRSFRKRQG
jgi:hypothetical protein